MTDRYPGFNVYTSSGALKFELAANRSGEPVISVDTANKSADGYDWGSKLTFQVTPPKPRFTGLVPEFEARNHGEDRSKSLLLENQPERG